MPLNASGLNQNLRNLFSEPPEGFTACAEAWADAVESYVLAITPPSTTVAAAAVVLQTALDAAFRAGAAAGDAAVTAQALEAAFAAFAVTVGGGMAGWSFVPPPALVGWLTAFQQDVPNTHQAAADRYADLIDTWMKTGTSTRLVSPFDTVNWS